MKAFAKTALAVSLAAMLLSMSACKKEAQESFAAPGPAQSQYSEPAHNPMEDEAAIYEILSDSLYASYTDCWEYNWYGATTDDQRVDAAEDLLGLLQRLGYDVSAWTPNTFAQEMNNYYDVDKTESVWTVACTVFGVSPTLYEDIYTGYDEDGAGDYDNAADSPVLRTDIDYSLNGDPDAFTLYFYEGGELLAVDPEWSDFGKYTVDGTEVTIDVHDLWQVLTLTDEGMLVTHDWDIFVPME